MISESFKRVNQIQDSQKITDDLLHVNSVAGLIQAIGYIKYVVGKADNKYGVAFRGQCKIYKTMKPTLYRDISKTSAKPLADKRLENLLSGVSISKGITLSKHLTVPEQYIEPLLQHYGLRTRWLDLVDNIWVALWFASYKYLGAIKPLVNFIQRPFDYKGDVKPKTAIKDVDDRFCYITLMRIPIGGKCLLAGHYSSDDAEIIDTRYCLPSFYLRPHVQHGLLVRMKTKKNLTALDFHDLVEGTIRIDLEKALDWIGKTPTLTTGALFPSPYVDKGLQQILRTKGLYDHLDIPLA